jgi:DNA helicase II / ATP-dependent DNA helicase PcrA
VIAIDSIIEALSAEQAAAVRSGGGRVVVTAGAGTGKTTTLVGRIAFLLASGVAPETIVAVTFTNKAAREVASRLKQKLGDDAYGVHIGTFHSLACKLLRRWAGHAGLEGSDFRIVDEDDARYLVLIAAVRAGLVPDFEPPARDGMSSADWEKKEAAARNTWELRAEQPIKEAFRQITLWKVWGLTAEMVDKPGRPARPDPVQERQARVFAAYEYELRKRNSLDFADLVSLAARTMGEHPDVRKAESSKVRYLLIDEAQDVNAVQKRFAQLLAGAHGNIFAVGDEDQSIMGFQASQPDAMRVIAGDGARSFGLTVNRRCTEQILKPALEVVNWNRGKKDTKKQLTSGREGAEVELVAYPTEVREAHAVAERIGEMLESGAKASEVAVLVRSAWTMEPFEEAFLRKRIPFNRVGGHSLLAREEFKDMVGYLRLAVAPHDDLAFRRIANRPARGLGPATVETIIQTAGSLDLTYSEACFSIAGSEARLRQDVRENLVKLARILEWLAVDGTSGRQTALMLDAILADTGYEDWIAREGGKKAKRKLKTLEFVRRVALEEDDASAFAQAVALMTDLDEESENAVRLSTIHSAKGLEFDHVFLPVWEAGVFPSERAVKAGVGGQLGDPWEGPVGGGLPEERRLAHVALTRAKKTVHVSYAMSRTNGGRGGPSPFVAEAGLSFVDMVEGVGRQGKGARRKAAAGRSGFARRKR